MWLVLRDRNFHRFMYLVFQVWESFAHYHVHLTRFPVGCVIAVMHYSSLRLCLLYWDLDVIHSHNLLCYEKDFTLTVLYILQFCKLTRTSNILQHKMAYYGTGVDGIDIYGLMSATWIWDLQISGLTVDGSNCGSGCLPQDCFVECHGRELSFTRISCKEVQRLNEKDCFVARDWLNCFVAKDLFDLLHGILFLKGKPVWLHLVGSFLVAKPICFGEGRESLHDFHFFWNVICFSRLTFPRKRSESIHKWWFRFESQIYFFT